MKLWCVKGDKWNQSDALWFAEHICSSLEYSIFYILPLVTHSSVQHMPIPEGLPLILDAHIRALDMWGPEYETTTTLE